MWVEGRSLTEQIPDGRMSLGMICGESSRQKEQFFYTALLGSMVPRFRKGRGPGVGCGWKDSQLNLNCR